MLPCQPPTNLPTDLPTDLPTTTAPDANNYPHLRIILCRTSGPINLGMIARTCGNWGIDDLWLVEPECPIDCDDTRKFANRAIDWLRQRPVVTNIDEALADVDLAIATSARPRAGQPPLLPAEIAPWLQQQPVAQRVALVFGNEQHGLNEAEHLACQTTMRLPMPGDYQSFNLAQAVATALALWPGHQTFLSEKNENGHIKSGHTKTVTQKAMT